MNIDNPKIEQKVQKLLNQMTLEEKVGEMTQMAIDVLSVGEPYNLQEPHTLDPNKLQKILVDLNVGSILNCGGHAYTREHWHEIMTTIKEYTDKKKNKIPVLYGIDAIHGTNYTIGSTLFPQQIGLAATFNPDLARKMGEITAYETRASYIPWTFSPVLDMGRDPRWPRLWETFGEDIFLAKKMGVATIKGYQGNDVNDPYKVAACMKHFLGYSTTWTGKDRSPTYVPERQLKEYFVPTFQAAVDAGAKTIMICSGEMNGIPVHANSKILKDLLRDEMGFKGLAVSDWEDILYLVSRHRVAKNHKEAIKMAVNAGIDMSMVPMNSEFPVLLKELVEEGEVSVKRIDEAVTRILTLKFELGLFENAFYAPEKYPDFASDEHAQASFETALESIALLKNEKNVLPLKKDAKILVTGPTANNLRCQNGGWTGTWQGDNEKYFTKGKKTFLQALQDKMGKNNVVYAEGTTFDKEKDLEAVKNAAKNVDAVVLFLGEMSYTEKPGDIDGLALPEAQHNLAKVVAESGKPVILILAEGRPRLISSIEPSVDAVVHTFLAGDEGGRALAEILVGDTNPSGKLPYTYPRFEQDLLTYDHKGTDLVCRDFSMNGFKPQFEFGYGLSYTTFEYSDLKISTNKLTEDGKLTIEIAVKNTGKMTGKEVVQLYITDQVATVTPSVKRLRGFEKVELAPNESKTVTFTIFPKDLAFVGIENEWVTEKGSFTVNMGGLTSDFEYVD